LAAASFATRPAYLAWVLVCTIWGTTYLAIRIALETIPPSLVGGLRYAAAGALLAVILAARGERLPSRATWGGLALLGFLMIGLGNGGVIWAEQWVPSGIAAVTVAAVPFWTTGLEAMIPGGERLTPRVGCGLLLGFGGILLLVWPDLSAGGAAGRAFAYGMVALQIACLGWSLGSVYSRRHARAENALGAAAVQMFLGGVFMLAVATARGEWTLLTFTGRSASAELYLTVVGSLAGYSAYVYALKYLPLSLVSLYAYVNPVIAVLLGAVVANEPFGWRVVAASGVVLSGMVIVQTGVRAARSRTEGRIKGQGSEAEVAP
jgi:drug/metabolite transporter (DMT)-like permease